MKVMFHTPGLDTPSWTAFGKRKIAHVLRRLHSTVRRVQVRLSSVPGRTPAGADVFRKCELEVDLPDGRVGRIEAVARTWRGALDAAAARLRRLVLSHLQRAHMSGTAPAPALAMAAPASGGASQPEPAARVHRLLTRS
jgi:hypothetical protein